MLTGTVVVVVVRGTDVVVTRGDVVVVVVASETSGFLIKKSIPTNRTSKTRRNVADCWHLTIILIYIYLKLMLLILSTMLLRKSQI